MDIPGNPCIHLQPFFTFSAHPIGIVTMKNYE